ncbi:hypothetical protein FQZ97_843690 [compost metagenome]
MPFIYLLKKIGQVTIGIRPYHQVYHFLFLQEFGFQPFCHTAQHAYLQARVSPLVGIQNTQTVPYPLLGIVTNGTGIQQNEIGLHHIGGSRIPVIPENRCHHFAVGEIHLAAITLYIQLLRSVHEFIDRNFCFFNLYCQLAHYL